MSLTLNQFLDLGFHSNYWHHHHHQDWTLNVRLFGVCMDFFSDSQCLGVFPTHEAATLAALNLRVLSCV